MKKVFQFVVLSIFLGWSAGFAYTIKVPDDYSTIQGAINAAVSGDTVLVSSGTYQENINFRGKNIVVTSYYGVTCDVSYIKNTIIDGSNPVYPDTASCVLIISGEDSSAVLQGFTLTGGKGTKWTDEHGAGTYVEGGGIFITVSSPTIRYNLIVNNEAINSPAGTVSAGGGAIRCGDGSPRILNNVILNNKGMYGGGIVLNYCSNALIANNIINANRVYQAVVGKQTYGGGGIWAYATLPGNNSPNIIENNTIIGNSSNTNGCGIRIWSTRTTIRNNIVWNNLEDDNEQINISGTGNTVGYNDVQYGISGTGNIDLQPSFADSNFYLNSDSPCIDAGNPDHVFNDPEDPNSSGNALFPSMGTVRNDIGAYGGSLSIIYPDFSSSILNISGSGFDFGLTLPGEPVTISVPIINDGSKILKIDSVAVMFNKTEIEVRNGSPILIHPVTEENLVLTWTPGTNKILDDTLLIYHNDPVLGNPYKLSITGNSYPNALLIFDATMKDFGNIDVNTPRVDTTIYVYNNGTAKDSVYTSIIYGVVNPVSALEITPGSFEVSPHDSVGVTFTIYPPLVNRTVLNIYQPKIAVDSKFSIGTTHFEKTMKFHLVGTTGVNDEAGLPDRFSLAQNFPNPFNPGTRIKYTIAASIDGTGKQLVTLKVYNILGKEVATLVNEEKQAGGYEIGFDATNLPSGVYFYTLNTGSYSQTRKMMLLK